MFLAVRKISIPVKCRGLSSPETKKCLEELSIQEFEELMPGAANIQDIPKANPKHFQMACKSISFDQISCYGEIKQIETFGAWEENLKYHVVTMDVKVLKNAVKILEKNSGDFKVSLFVKTGYPVFITKEDKKEGMMIAPIIERDD